MASWRPTTREPDAIRAALYDYLRNRAAKVFLNGRSDACPLGRADMTMSDGGRLVVDLRITPVETRARGTRAVIVFDVAGHAAEPTQGYEVEGQIVLDRETQAFLSIDVVPVVINARR